MLKYAKIINNETKEVSIALGKNPPNDYTEMEVEKAYNGNWYLLEHAPQKPEPTYAEKRLAEYPALSEQFDMIYWDKVNGTNLWQEKIAEIKTKYPKV